MKFKKYTLYGLVVFILLASCKSNLKIDINSLIKEMTNKESLTMYPSSDFRLLQQSSYSKRSIDPKDSVGWFHNKDVGNFIRIEENCGRKEWVVFEHEGPGTIVRTWTTQGGYSNHIVRFYFDNSEIPAIEGNLIDLFSGGNNSIAPYPFTNNSYGGPEEYEKKLGSAVCYLPIPFAQSLKITYSEPPRYYIYTYRTYPLGTKVETFSMEQLQKANGILENAGDELIKANPCDLKSKTIVIQKELAGFEKCDLKLPDGEKSVRELIFETEDSLDAQILRQTTISIKFDDNTTVSCPVGDFFGTGFGFNPFHSFYRTITDNGKLICRWIMPYRENAKITIANNQDKKIHFSLSAKIGNYKWDERSMYFYASWYQEKLNTRPPQDWSYVNLNGKGVYAGDVLTVINPHEFEWWGEGDAKIFVDGESFPSMFGTGTEDYYGYAYGGQNRAFFEHPFYGQLCANNINKFFNMGNYVQIRTTKGVNVVTRTRSLDGIPFSEKLVLNMGVLHSATLRSAENVEIDYSVCSYWYGFNISNDK